jgi:hypothetical protein
LYQAPHFGNALIHGPYHPIPIATLKPLQKSPQISQSQFLVNLLKVSKSVDLGGINNNNNNNNNNRE